MRTYATAPDLRISWVRRHSLQTRNEVLDFGEGRIASALVRHHTAVDPSPKSRLSCRIFAGVDLISERRALARTGSHSVGGQTHSECTSVHVPLDRSSLRHLAICEAWWLLPTPAVSVSACGLAERQSMIAELVSGACVTLCTSATAQGPPDKARLAAQLLGHVAARSSSTIWTAGPALRIMERASVFILRPQQHLRFVYKASLLERIPALPSSRPSCASPPSHLHCLDAPDLASRAETHSRPTLDAVSLSLSESRPQRLSPIMASIQPLRCDLFEPPPDDERAAEEQAAMDPSHESNPAMAIEQSNPTGASPRISRLIKPVRYDLFTPPTDDEIGAAEQPPTEPSGESVIVTASDSEQPTATYAPPRVERLIKPVCCDLFTPPIDDGPAAAEPRPTEPWQESATATTSNSEQRTATLTQLSVNDSNEWFSKTCKDVVPPDTLQTAVTQGVSTSTSGTVLASTEKLWPDSPQTIHYCFLPGDHVGSNVQQDKVRNAIQEWSDYANVRFVEGVDPASCDIRITFDPKDGSWSYVGTHSRIIEPRDATMNLAWLQASASMTANERASILHEFGHVLCLLHEHQSAAHGGTAIDVQAALELYRSDRRWSDKQIHDQVLDVYNQYDVSNYSQVDVASIMHFPQPKELTGLDQDIGYNKELSDLDKAYVVVQYPRENPPSEAPQWTFDYALGVIGCPESVGAAAARCQGASEDGARASRREASLAGPNGESLASNYTKALHSLVPSYEGAEARRNREEMRAWLLADTESSSAASLSTDKGASRADIPSTAEILQDAKDALRESRLSSFSADPSVFPVKMDPKDWHDALDAGHTADELSQDPALLHAVLRSND
ncbi:hypothetical protein L1887_54902 [Cichorium endivia]|nr:hypothetical protein L1887_54902 [Cichorium endivia]